MKRNPEMIGGEGDKTAMWKRKRSGLENKNRKEDEVCGKENENKGEQRRWWKQRWKW